MPALVIVYLGRSEGYEALSWIRHHVRLLSARGGDKPVEEPDGYEASV